MFRPFVTPYLIGLVTAPLVGIVAKPLLHNTLKAAIALSFQVKKLAAEAGEEFQDLAAEVSADMAEMSAVRAATTARPRNADTVYRNTA